MLCRFHENGTSVQVCKSPLPVADEAALHKSERGTLSFNTGLLSMGKLSQ